MTQAVQLAQYGSNNVGLSFKNRIINGNMVISQRNGGTTFTTPATFANVYTLDRWAYFASVGTRYTVQQNAGAVTPPTGFSNYIGITSTAATTFGATDLFLLRQFIEGFNVTDLAWGTASAVPVTLSFWVRSSLTGSFTGAISAGATSNSYPFTYTVNSANTWQYITVPIPETTVYALGTGNTVGLQVNFTLGAGSSNLSATSAWAAGPFGITGSVFPLSTNGATLYITGVQLEKGTVATSFDYLPYSTQLMLCQRYYEQSSSFLAINSNNYSSYNFIVPKRASAAVTISAGTQGSVTADSLGFQCTGTSTVSFNYKASAEL
jgi:hypothetical protein